MVEVFFDVETQKLFSDITSQDPADLGVSVVSVYRRVTEKEQEQEGKMQSFWYPSVGLAPVIDAMWTWFESADRIIGFNSKKFDVPALRLLYRGDLFKLPHFDILEKVREKLGRRIGLNALAQQTLGKNKVDVGSNAVYYFANPTQENLEKLRIYCEEDVLLTKALYDFGMKHNHLTYMDTKWNRIETIPVDFSYPIPAQKPQMGLF